MITTRKAFNVGCTVSGEGVFILVTFYESSGCVLLNLTKMRTHFGSPYPIVICCFNIILISYKGGRLDQPYKYEDGSESLV